MPWRVSSVLENFGLVDASWYTESSRERGDLVHLIAEQVFQARPITVSPAFDGYRRAIESARDALGLMIICVERRLTSGVISGRPDVIGWVTRPVGTFLHPGPVIGDIKSGAARPSHQLQLQFYVTLAEQLGLRASLPAAFRSLPWQRLGIYVHENGGRHFHPYRDVDDRFACEGMLDTLRWRQKHGILGSDWIDDARDIDRRDRFVDDRSVADVVHDACGACGGAEGARSALI